MSYLYLLKLHKIHIITQNIHKESQLIKKNIYIFSDGSQKSPQKNLNHHFLPKEIDFFSL